MAEVSGNKTDVVELSAADPTLVVDSGASILTTTPDGVYGDEKAVWAVTNKGTITSGGAPGTDGIYLQGPSSVVENDGSISGSGGVFLGAGGTVTNALDASISASGSPATVGAPAVSGIDVEYGFGTVLNYGTIGSKSYGVALEAGGAVTNYASGSITGVTDAVYSVRASATIDNFGQLTATVGDGVGFYNGGALINEIGGVTTGSASGSSAVKFHQFSGSLQNDGAMRGDEAGAYFQAGGTVVNGVNNASALLQGANFGVYLSNLPGSTSLESVTNYGVITATAAGSYGVYIDGNGGTVTNAGTITGSAYSVYFAVTNAGNRLIVDPGAIFNGLVAGGGGTLELAGTSASTFGASIGSTGNFRGFSALQVDEGAIWTLSASVSIPTVLLDGVLEVASSLKATSVLFYAGGKLIVDNASSFTSPLLENFVAGDVIDIHGIAAAGAMITYNMTTGVATIVNGAKTVKLNFQASTLGAGTFQLVSDGGTGVDVVLAICFMAGTQILTPYGEVAVETLRRGDLVLTADGAVKPVIWLGRQTISTLFADPIRVWPIRVKAGALGENLPSRDLVLSPDHALLVGGVLIHAGALVNGLSIVREGDVPEVFTYFHVELDDHSLILAENTPAETFVDNVERLAFDNWAEHEALYPDGKPIRELPYPRAKARRQVPMDIRAILAERAERIGATASVAVA